MPTVSRKGSLLSLRLAQSERAVSWPRCERATAAHEAELSRIAERHEQALDDADRMVATLVAACPWALRGFDEPTWDCYAPDVAARYPDGVRVGLFGVGSAAEVPPLPAIARLAGHGHVLIRSDRGHEDGGAHCFRHWRFG